MHTVLLSAEYPPTEGGVGDYTQHLARALQQANLSVSILTSASAQADSNGPVHALMRDWGWGCLSDILRFLRQYSPDILHLQYQTGAYHMHPAIHFLPEILRRLSSPPRLVVTMHDLRLPYLFPKAGPLRHWVVAHLLRRADAVVVTNRADLGRLQGEGSPTQDVLRPLRPGSLQMPPRLIPLGSSLPPTPPGYDRADWRARLNVQPGEALLGYFGLLHPSKGADLLVEAMAGLAQAGQSVRLLIVGGGSGSSDPGNSTFQEKMRAQIDQAGLRDALIWTGPVSAEEASAHLCACDLIVLPYRDGASFRRSSMIAALSLGRVVLTTEPLGPDEVTLDSPQSTLRAGQHAALVPREDSAGLQEALAELLQDPAQRHTLSQGAVQLGQAFQWRTIARKTASLYNYLQARRGTNFQALGKTDDHSLLELFPDDIFTCDLDGRLVYANLPIRERTGYSLEELLGADLGQIMPPSQHDALQEHLERLKQGELPVDPIEHEVESSPGQKHITEIVPIPLRDGDRIYGMMGITRDITRYRRAERELGSYSQQLQALLGTLWGLWAELDLEALLQRIVEEAVTLIPGAQAGSLLLRRGNHYVFRGAVGYDIEGLGKIRVPHEALLARQLSEGQVVHLTDIAIHNQEYLDEATAALLERYGRTKEIQSLLVSPIIWKDDLLGYINIDNFEQKNAFAPESRDLLAQLALQAGVAIQHAQLYQAAQEQRAVAETLREVGTVLASTLDLDQVLDHIIGELHRIVPYDAANVMLLEEGMVCIRRSRGYETYGVAQEIAGWSFPVEQYVNLLLMLQEQRPVVISDTQADSDWVTLPRFEWLRAYAGAPIRLRGQVVGFLNADSSTAGFYQQEHGTLLQAVADQAAIAISNARLYGQAQQRLAQLELLLETSTALTATLEVELLLNLILESAIQAIPSAEKGSILLQDLVAKELYIAALRGYEDPRVQQSRFCEAVGYSARSFRAGRPMLIPDARSDAEIRYDGEIEEIRAIRSAAVAPLEVRGKIIGAISLDNSSQKEAFSEDDLRLLTTMAHHAAIAIDKAQLFQEQRQALEALQVAQRQLTRAQKMEAIGRLAGGVAHDFNNFLTGLMLNVDVALLDVPPQHPLYSNLQEIHSLVERASRLTRQLLLMSRRQVSEPRLIDLNQVIQGALKILRRVIGEDIQIHTELTPNPGTILADPVQMEQVLLNLTINARDAMPNGGVLTIRTTSEDLSEAVQRRYLGAPPGRYAVLSVGDTGGGIPAEVMDHMFEPFFTTKEQGTGLGLAVVYGIVNQHGGDIWVYSEPGQGAVFKVYLPTTPEPAQPLEISPAEQGMPQGSETILLVEDETSVRETTRAILEAHGYQVRPASDGQEAQEIAAEYGDRIGLVLTDMVLPGISGLELVRDLRQDRPDLPVIVSTGYSDRAVQLEGEEGRHVLLLPKPFTAATLLQRVREALEEE